jgi:hypothetical protein
MKNSLITEEIIFWVKLESNVKHIYIIFVATNVGAFRHSYSIDKEKKRQVLQGVTRENNTKNIVE